MFFRTYFKYYNTTSEFEKDELKKIFLEIDITDNSLQNKINNVYLYSQRKNKDRRSVLDKLLDIQDSKGDKMSILYNYNSSKDNTLIFL